MEQIEAYLTPLGCDADAKLATAFDRIAEAEDEDPLLEIEARRIRARRRAGGVVWFDFAVLCGGPRSHADYLEIAAQFHTVLLSNIPQMSAGQASEARRFTWLVDVLYDHRVKLVASAEVAADRAVHERRARRRICAHGLPPDRDAVARVPGRAPPRRGAAGMSRSAQSAAATLGDA